MRCVRGRVAGFVLRRKHDERERRAVGYLVRALWEVDPLAVADREDLLDLGAHPVSGRVRGDARTPVGEELVEVRLEAEPVAVLLGRKKVAGVRQSLETLLDVPDVEVGLGHCEPNLR